MRLSTSRDGQRIVEHKASFWCQNEEEARDMYKRLGTVKALIVDGTLQAFDTIWLDKNYTLPLE